MVNLHPLIILDINTYKIIRTIDDHLHSNNNDNSSNHGILVGWGLIPSGVTKYGFSRKI